ncbi:hypothetical protein [Nocardia cyriacigeorgica]|uniref:hypothetical protein n=1 Tax=Nocardia cyriacigeorgica TaxID=135487 RepID=UPI00245764D5|nr:hypothetical protein [Nocardia cyriacigeorgica]
MTALHRLNVIPSPDWSAVPTGGTRLVWAEMDGDVIATYWEAPDHPAEGGSGWQLIRTDVLPFDSGVVGGPPPYRPRQSGIDGAVAFINSGFFLWTYEIPAWFPAPEVGAPPPVGVVGHTPELTLYPENKDIAPPAP